MPAPSQLDHDRLQLALTFGVAPGCVLLALCLGYAVGTHGGSPALRWTIAALLLLTAASSAMAGVQLRRLARAPVSRSSGAFLGHGGAALAVYCLSVLASFGLVLLLLEGP